MFLSLLLLFSVFLPTISENIPVAGQCQAICLQQFAKAREDISLTAKVYMELDVTNNTDFSLCKLGCHSPSFNELALPAFRKGQKAYETVVERTSDASLRNSPLEKISLLCVDPLENGTISGRILLETIEFEGPIVHFVEVARRETMNDTYEESILFQAWSYSSMLDFSASLRLSDSSISMRVTSFDKDGQLGSTVSSALYSREEILDSINSPIKMKLLRTSLREESASAEISFSSTRLSVCTFSFFYRSHSGNDQSFEFTLDRSRGILLERLQFDEQYSVRLESLGSPKGTTSLPSASLSPVSASLSPVSASLSPVSSSLSLRIPPCLQMTADPTLCAPPAVSSVEWKWNCTEPNTHTISLSWQYGAHLQDIDDHRRESVARMVHFDVLVRALETRNQQQCLFVDTQRRVVTWTHRSVIIYVLDEKCNYEIEIIVVDSRNRKSPSNKIQVVRYLDQKSMLTMSAKWNTEMMIIISVLIFVLLVATTMAICRARDRHDFQTLKKQHRALTNSIVVTHSASTLPRSHLAIINGKGRPISSDESEKCSRESVNNLERYYADEGVYDSLDTPTGTESFFANSSSFGSFSKATPLQQSTVPGAINVLLSSLQVSTCARRVSKNSMSALVVDKSSSLSYTMKFSEEDSTGLREELRVLTRIDSNHDNIVGFHGVVLNHGLVVGILLDATRGGTLSHYLRSLREDLISCRTPSPTSSGYHGSLQSQQRSADRSFQLIDQFTSHLYKFASQIANALVFLHDQHVIHGEVSSERVHLQKTWTESLYLPCDQSVKLGDFDFSYHECENVRLGSVCKRAPEGEGNTHYSGDIWQLGLLLAELVTLGQNCSLFDFGPLNEKSVKTYYSRLTTGLDPAYKVDPCLVQLKQKIPRCLHLDPKKRSNAKMIAKDLMSIQRTAEPLVQTDSVEV